MLAPLLPGTYLLHLPHEPPDAKEWRHVVRLDPGAHRDLRLEAPPGAAVADRVEPRTKLTGFLLLPDGKTPARYAAVSRGSEWEPTTFADADGRFALDVLAGQVTLFARGDGSALTALSVDAAGASKEVRLLLQPGATITGRVRSPGMVLPPDLCVAALPLPARHPPWMALVPVRPDGSFALHGLEPGETYLCLYRKCDSACDGWRLNNVLPVPLRAGESQDDVSIEARPERSRLCVFVRRGDGGPLPSHLYVHLLGEYGGLDCHGTRVRGGVASFHDVPAGTFAVWAETAPRWVTRDLGTAASVVRKVVVTPGDDAQRITVILPESAFLADGRTPARRGRVTILLGPGGPTASDSLQRAEARRSAAESQGCADDLARAGAPVDSYAEADVSPDGSFRLYGLAPGWCRVAVEGSGAAATVSEPVQVVPGKLADVGGLVVR